MTLQEFKAKYPDIYQASFDEGRKAGHDNGFTEGEVSGLEKGRAEGAEQARAEGARAERERIASVEAQSIPGHEALIGKLKFDGKTTGEQAAVQILQAEKTLRQTTSTQLDKDAPASVVQVVVPDVETSAQADRSADANLPVEDRAKAAWDKDPDLRAEFMNTFDSYLAFVKADEAGQVKILKR